MKLGELGEPSFGMMKLGKLGETSFGISKLSELGETSFGRFKSRTLELSKLGMVSFGNDLQLDLVLLQSFSWPILSIAFQH